MRFTVQRLTSGRRAANSCVKATRKNRKAKRCTRTTTLPGSFTRERPAGNDRFTLTARINNRTLPPGRYTLTATPTTQNRTGTPARARFTITR